jgi:hypothetical protein
VARKVTLALTSDLFDVLLPLLQNLTFWKMLSLSERATPALGDKTAKLAESPEKLFRETV